jgi:hypothetical protein
MDCRLRFEPGDTLIPNISADHYRTVDSAVYYGPVYASAGSDNAISISAFPLLIFCNGITFNEIT